MPDASAAVTPPKILHFEQAPYPPEAEKLGIEANVILRLDIDKDGKVTAVAVDRARRSRLRRSGDRSRQEILFEPARRGTTPIPARILYRYGVHLARRTPDEAKPSASRARR